MSSFRWTPSTTLYSTLANLTTEVAAAGAAAPSGRASAGPAESTSRDAASTQLPIRIRVVVALTGLLQRAGGHGTPPPAGPSTESGCLRADPFGAPGEVVGQGVAPGASGGKAQRRGPGVE